MRSQNQYTIYALNDVVTQSTAPSNPYKGQLWVDTSKTPPVTMVYNGSKWLEQNGTDTIKTSLKTVEDKQAEFKTSLDGLSSTVSSQTQTIEVIESDLNGVEENVTSIQSELSTLKQTTTEISADVSSKVDNEYGSSTSSFGWSLKSNGFFIYSNKKTAMQVTSSGLEVNGKITSASGSIGGFTIGNSSISSGVTSFSDTSHDGVYVGTDGIRLGSKFSVNAKGEVTATGLTINLTNAQKQELKGEKGDTGAQGPQGIQGPQGARGPNGESVPYLTVKSNEYDHDHEPCKVYLNGVEIVSNKNRGHTLIIFDPATKTIESNNSYDTYEQNDSMNTALSSVPAGKIVILVSWDATSLTSEARGSLRDMGSKMTSTWTATRNAHAFIGMKGLDCGCAYEAVGNGPNGNVTISAYFTERGIIENGSEANLTFDNCCSALGITSNSTGIYSSNGKLIINATAGRIGNFVVEGNNIHNGTWGADNSIMLCTGTSSSKVIGNSGNINGWVITAGSKFGVTKNGDLYASNANISGSIIATSGTFDNCTFNSSCVLYGKLHMENSAVLMIFGTYLETTYSTDVGGVGTTTNIVGTYHADQLKSTAYTSPYGMVIVPDAANSTNNFVVTGMLYGIMKTTEYNTDEILSGLGIHYREMGGTYAQLVLKTGKGVSVFDAKYDSTSNHTLDIGYYSFYVAAKGYWTFSSYVFFGSSSSNYRVRIDEDQVTFSYSGKFCGELEGYSSYVDIQGTWKTNGNNWISSSDRNLKKDIELITEDYESIFDNLKPVKFKWKDGTSNRTHTGFIAQDVKQAIEDTGHTTQDFAAYVKFDSSEKNGEIIPESCGVRYEEITPLNTWEIQKLKKRVKELEKIVEELKNENI